MKFIKENTGKGVRISNAALNMSNLAKGLLELRAENGVVMLFKQHMTVADLLKTADALSKTAAGLIEKLTAACGECDGCDAECLFCQPEDGRFCSLDVTLWEFMLLERCTKARQTVKGGDRCG